MQHICVCVCAEFEMYKIRDAMYGDGERGLPLAGTSDNDIGTFFRCSCF